MAHGVYMQKITGGWGSARTLLGELTMLSQSPKLDPNSSHLRRSPLRLVPLALILDAVPTLWSPCLLL